MPIGTIVLLALLVLVFFGLLHRVLDRMRLSDRGALLVIIALIAGSFVNFTLVRTPPLLINLGGAVVPAAVAVYLGVTTDTRAEKWRAVLAPLGTAALIYLLQRILPADPEAFIIEPMYLYGVVAGGVGYLAGRSRRLSLIAASGGLILAGLAHFFEMLLRGLTGQTWIGGGGAFDAVVVASVIAVGLAEIAGETRERVALRSQARGRDGGRRGGRREH